ncbi:MAG: hypothetical protein ACYCO9_10410 [Streptosporangiaceae bacterium]
MSGRSGMAAACAVLLATGGAATLASCGAAPAGAALKPIPASGAARIARAVSLKAADLPGYVALPPGTRVWNPQSGRPAACLRVYRIAPTAVRTSPEFSTQSGLSGGRASSLTATYRSRAAAARVFSALSGQPAAQCLQSSILGYLAPLAAQGGLTLQPSVQVTALPVSIAGVSHAFAYRMAVAAQPRSPSRQPFTIYVDLYGAATGQVLIEVATYSTGQPVPGNIAQRLLRLLARRARSLLGTVPPPRRG